jgi:hypothetical protein
MSGASWCIERKKILLSSRFSIVVITTSIAAACSRSATGPSASANMVSRSICSRSTRA